MPALFLFFYLLSSPLFATGSVAEIESDPCQRINYHKAFDLSALQKKYADLMVALGCASNVFKEIPTNLQTRWFNQHHYIALDVDDPETKWKEQLKQYQTSCINHLYAERRAIITRPAKECALIMAAIVGFTSAMSHISAADTSGASIISTTITSLYYIPILIRSLYNWAYTPPQPIDKYELKYVVNQCFIPRQLWPILLTKFLLARNNVYAQQDALDFIGFTLGLTTFKKKITKRPSIALQEAQHDLLAKIDLFFANYNSCDPLEIAKIKCNLVNFLAVLYGEKRRMRYLYLKGPGGIGKTYFAEKLSEWLEEIYPRAVHFETPQITTTAELEGNDKKPGAMLRALRNQSQQRKKSTLLFIDEASWLNDEDPAPVKRVFNGDHTKLVTSYFGLTPKGDSVEIDLSPMLVILAGNDEIEDEALKSRFDCFDFPRPQQKTLEDFAIRQIIGHPDAQAIDGMTEGNHLGARFQETLSERLQGLTNFRQVASYSERLIQIWCAE